MNQNHDRVNEVYYGTLFNERTQQLLRERILWICERVRGKYILDVGCSQGITSILLGRQAFKVTGIDREEQAIEYANKELEKEEPDTRANVTFIHANVLTYNFDLQFDTVILGEVLEHFIQPELVVEKVWGVLKKNGCLIVTVPFGINNHPDHKQTYYLFNLLKQIHPFFTIKKTKIIGKWLCVVLKKRTKKVEEALTYVPVKAVTFAESAFFEREKELNQKIKILQDRLNDLMERQKRKD